MRWAERRAVMVEEIGAAAHMALAQCVNATSVGQGRDAKDFATTLGILVDKAQLLSGAATARSEHLTPGSAIDAEIAELVELMRQQDAA